MASTDGPEAEFHDPRRRELLQALNDALPPLRPTAWACLWFCDIDKLEELLALAQTMPAVAVAFFEGTEVSARIVPTWTQRKRPASAASTPQNPSTPQDPSTTQNPSTPQNSFTPLQPFTPQRPTTPLQQPPSAQGSRGQKRNNSGQYVITRSKVQRKLCHQRDQKTCILTKSGEPNEIAHIYPFSMRNEDDTIKREGSFWGILRMFWSKERVDAWYNAILPLGTENVRRQEASGYSVFSGYRQTPHVHVLEVNILQVPSLSASDQGPNLAKLFNHMDDTKIHSGCEISLETDDPVSRPLPDFRLLEMQWFLHRVAAISGAAEPQDDFHDDDDNSDDDIVEALRNRRDMYMEDDWDMGIEEGPAMCLETSPERLWEERFPAQPPGIQTFGHMVSLRGGRGYGEGEDREGEDVTVKDREGEDREGEDREGEDREGEDREGEDREGEDREGEDREGEDREGEDREGEDREGEDHKEF
ncbi:hypothetical protein K469DRAFT_753606 [Zopfia rhizophila CBS 207.26]|uniref:HNH nuclease domain-containing protein n=1 Tax=Zopfia rhizophila CBS 207.26 TaxID=1314779 RepID=A0A6A6DKX7_9PEZI|nr:hypothetical protein K469DRAFT_753606 [Zopfia rhizophila CBS 207.26]